MKNNNVSNDNKKIVTLSIVIIAIIGIAAVIISFINGKGSIFSGDSQQKIKDVLSSNKEAVIFVENSNSKKCDKCDIVRKTLNNEKIDYILYDVNKVTKDEYKEMLQSLSINVADFNYPAVIYVKDGVMYSNIINIDSEKAVKTFISDYKLKK